MTKLLSYAIDFAALALLYAVCRQPRFRKTVRAAALPTFQGISDQAENHKY